MNQLKNITNYGLSYREIFTGRYWKSCAVHKKFSDICVRNGMATSGVTVSRLYELATKFNRFYLFGE